MATDEITALEEANLALIHFWQADFASLRLTKTGLEKSILDATSDFRNFLVSHYIHDYDSQKSGAEFKVTRSVDYISQDAARQQLSASFYRSRTRSDPRVSFSNLKNLFRAGDLLLWVVKNGESSIFNASRTELLPSGSAYFPSGKDASSLKQVSKTRALSDLWDRATGGGDVAAHPTSDNNDHWGKAPRPAGVDEAAEWLLHGLNETVRPRYLFLIGGPGAGKSHAAAAIAKNLTEVNPPTDGLAHRTYDYVSNAGKELRIINDATIRDSLVPDSELINDINYVEKTQGNLLACVNRGILVEESSYSAKHNHENISAGDIIISSLTGGSAFTENRVTSWKLSENFSNEYLHSGTLTHDGRNIADVVTIFVDVCSLFEKNPKVSLPNDPAKNEEIQADAYEIAKFDSRRLHSNEDSPAGALLSQLLESLEVLNPASEVMLDPIRANLESLTSTKIRSGLLSLLRASEIVSSQRMTYRELWGAYVRCIVADLPEIIERGDIQNYLHGLQPKTKNPMERFRSIRKLAELRFSQSLFTHRHNSRDASQETLSNPILRLTSLVDPIKDSIPGHLKGNIESGWATPISDAFTGPLIATSPLESLLNELKGTDDAFLEIITDFDKYLDSEFINITNSPDLTEKDRYHLIGWYGRYLTRLYAIANGIPAFANEINEWTIAWVHSPDLTPSLDSKIRTLLRPLRDPDSQTSASLIPLFDSRTDPIIGNISSSKLALRLGDVELITQRNGEHISLSIREESKVVGTVPLDFSLVREANAAAAGRPGITELSNTNSPRIERYRSARLVFNQLNQARYCIVTGNDEALLSVGKK